MKYKKLLLLGITAIISLNTMATFASPADIDFQTAMPIAQKVQILKEEGILKDTNVIIKKVNKNDTVEKSAEAGVTTTGPNCYIIISTKDGNTAAFNGGENSISANLTTDMQLSKSELQINTDRTLLHEIAHCKMTTEIKDIYKTGNESIDKILKACFIM